MNVIRTQNSGRNVPLRIMCAVRKCNKLVVKWERSLMSVSKPVKTFLNDDQWNNGGTEHAFLTIAARCWLAPQETTALQSYKRARSPHRSWRDIRIRDVIPNPGTLENFPLHNAHREPRSIRVTPRAWLRSAIVGVVNVIAQFFYYMNNLRNGLNDADDSRYAGTE